ncbi:uncharacterized protein LOC120342176 isoform X1 [Styela clava]
MIIIKIVLHVLLFVSIHCLTRQNQQLLRRLKRQSSRTGLIPPKIPYASLSAGVVPSRVRSRLRSGVGSSQSTTGQGGSSQGASTQGTGSTGATGYGQQQYTTGGQGYPYGGSAYPNTPTGQGYGQQLYGQQSASGQDGQAGVPLGRSTFPYANSQQAQQGYQQEYQTQSSTRQYPSVPQYGMGRGGYQQPTGYQPTGAYNPYGGVGGYGYGGGYQMGGNPYAAGGGMYGMQQMPYINPYGMSQGGYYGAGAGYQSRGYSDAPSIGSAYRDPTSPYTSFVHPNPPSAGSSSRYGGRQSYGQSYGGGGRSGGSYGANPYGSSSTQGGYGGGGSSYYGSDSTGGYSGSSYGGTQPPTDNSYGQTYGGYSNSGGGYGSTGESADSGAQGGSVPSYGSSSSSSNPYGNTVGSAYGGASYGGGSSDASESIYGQTSGSRYATSGSRYGYGEGQNGAGVSESGGGYGSYGQSQTYQSQGAGVASSQSSAGQRGVGDSQVGGYYNPLSSQSSVLPGAVGAQFTPPYQQQGQYGSQPEVTGETRTQGRFSSQQIYQTGRFYSPQTSDSNTRSEDQPGVGVSAGGNADSVTPSSSDESPSAPVPADEPSGSRSVYPDHQGIFLVPSRLQPNPEETREVEVQVNERNKAERKEPPTKRPHPSLRKCRKLSDGLPDLYVDAGKMQKSVFVQTKSISKLSCAKEENCLAKSANDRNPVPVRKLLRFATVVHNGGTAVFLPDAHHRDWKYHSCHDHYHSMKEFAHFHLLFSNGTIAAEGHKVSFCLQDSGCKNPCTKEFTCNKTTQGISPGCHDDYLASRDCQWIDITDVFPGAYTLRVTVNPLVNGIRAVPELSYTNNAIECPVSITMTKAETTGRCRLKR